MDAVRLTIPETAAVTAVTAAQIRRWIKTCPDLIIRHEDRVSGGRGEETLLSIHTAMQLFVAGRLTEAGAQVRDALVAGRSFAHVGDELRLPSQTFESGQTWLLAAGDSHRIANIKQSSPNERLTYPSYASLGDAVASFSSRVRSAGDCDVIAPAIITMNLDLLPLVVEQRIRNVLLEKRHRNTRLSSGGAE